MKTEYQDIVKEFLRKEIIDTAKEQHLTDEKVAELLNISVRSYCYIKSGRNCCSTITLLYFLVNMCPSTEDFINKVKNLIS